MRILGIIPSRYASTRFPGKPLADIDGKSMIRRVYEQAGKSASLSGVIVATDDDRIHRHIEDIGGRSVITSDKHQSGTDRCAEVARAFPEYDVFINIQGDEPFIDPGQIDLLAGCFKQPGTQLATLIKKISLPEELTNPNIPKVVVNINSEALYFSRHPIPYQRNADPAQWLQEHVYYKHIGIYGYRRQALNEITLLPASALENAESLEQLRWIEHGYTIRVVQTGSESLAIDTPEDLQKALLHNRS